jgi:hypothetical protein
LDLGKVQRQIANCFNAKKVVFVENQAAGVNSYHQIRRMISKVDLS